MVSEDLPLSFELELEDDIPTTPEKVLSFNAPTQGIGRRSVAASVPP